jgi:hypothetical protein
MGVLFVIVGVFIISGLDKDLQTKVLDSGYFNIGIVEQKLLDRVELPEVGAQVETSEVNEIVTVNIPKHIERLFGDTDFSKADPDLANALSGGPGKDGIPALDEPKFIPLSEADYPDSIQAIVLKSESGVKIYPYNILTWHEIVNDDFDGTPVAVTFCPLCGSAIVYDRTLPDGTVTTIGVSGSLLESNMIMYDRATENLWQQSTGKTLAGSFHPAALKVFPMQLLTLGEAREAFSDAQILSTKTGHNREYDRNPYAGYETDNRFVFEPSNIDETLNPKEIVVIFRSEDETPIAIPWLKLRELKLTNQTVKGTDYNFVVSDSSELTITDGDGNNYPFYFEMWFSFAAQHETGELIEL